MQTVEHAANVQSTAAPEAGIREYERASDASGGSQHAEMPAETSMADLHHYGPEKILTALIEVLRRESELLGKGTTRLEAGVTRQKLQLMMQLNRIDPQREIRNSKTRELLAETRRLLEANGAMLKRRMEAIREIAGMISREITDAQSDGTYDLSAPSAGYGQF